MDPVLVTRGVAESAPRSPADGAERQLSTWRDGTPPTPGTLEKGGKERRSVGDALDAVTGRGPRLGAGARRQEERGTQPCRRARLRDGAAETVGAGGGIRDLGGCGRSRERRPKTVEAGEINHQRRRKQERAHTLQSTVHVSSIRLVGRPNNTRLISPMRTILVLAD